LLATDVVEVHRAAWVSPLPRAPAIVEGVLDVRGEVLPVIDLHRRFGLPAKAMELADHLVVVQAGPRRVVVHVGPAVDLLTAPVEDLEQAVEIAPYARGAARLPDGVVLIHDPEAFLAPAERVALDRALDQRHEP
jgi:purine-binding chemotaxis protein CheW